MNGTLEQLVALQAIDIEMVHFRARLASLPKSIADAETARATAAASLAALQTKLKDEDTARRRTASDAEDARTKLARLTRQMDSASSTQQANALQHEIDFARAGITRAEDDELASMERTEALEAELPTRTAALDKATQSLVERKESAASLAVEYKAELAGRETERAELRAQTDPDALSLFDRLTKSRGTAVAEAKGQQCSACRMMLRPQRWQLVTAREDSPELLNCESCGRILFYDLRNDRPGTWPTGDRLRRALTLDSKA